jgi:putative peptide maturation dehydrogenase
MPRLRRTAYLFLTCEDERLVAYSALAGEERTLDEADLRLLLSIPEDRDHEVEQCTSRLRDLANSGLVVSDEPDSRLAELRSADERLRSGEWQWDAAMFHRRTAWCGLEVQLDPDTPAEEGPPLPEAFHSVPDAAGLVELPLVERRGGLYDVLARRATTRIFERSDPLAVGQLSVLLRYVWGCHGFFRIKGGGHALRKTSPSGGALHPVEVYLLACHVDGLEPGLYHYRPGDHALDVLERFARDEAEALTVDFTAGQQYLAGAQALFVMTARFYRSFWRYRRHDKAYAAQLMDAAHLSQTFYLVAADLGIGAFITLAINNGDIDDRLGLASFEEGSIAICGCGVPAPDPPRVHQPRFRAYVPRETTLAKDA